MNGHLSAVSDEQLEFMSRILAASSVSAPMQTRPPYILVRATMTSLDGLAIRDAPLPRSNHPSSVLPPRSGGTLQPQPPRKRKRHTLLLFLSFAEAAWN